VIDLSLVEPILAMLGPKAAEYRLTGTTTPRLGSRCMIQAPRDVYPTRDGRYVALSTGTQAMAERLFRAIGAPELNDDPRFSTNAARLQHREEVERIVAGFIAGRTQAETLAFFEAAEVTVAPVCDEADLAEHPYISEREVLIEVPDEAAAACPCTTSPHASPRRPERCADLRPRSASTTSRSCAASAYPRRRSRISPKRACSGRRRLARDHFDLKRASPGATAPVLPGGGQAAIKRQCVGCSPQSCTRRASRPQFQR
jgi:crotonobetainyl-CoA:carnitine CoA-transferase CaiB-like acyl-CoA transferase